MEGTGLSEPVLTHEMALYVKHEHPAAEAIERDARIYRSHLFQLEEAAGSA